MIANKNYKHTKKSLQNRINKIKKNNKFVMSFKAKNYHLKQFNSFICCYFLSLHFTGEFKMVLYLFEKH